MTAARTTPQTDPARSPRGGAAPERARRAALVDALIHEVGAAGTLDVTVARIARRAGMSPALAHHYFGSKDRMLLAAMRRLLRDFAHDARAARAAAPNDPRARLAAIARASFFPAQFDGAVVSAWLLFYQRAQASRDAARLLAAYRRRLHRALTHDLGALLPGPAARRVAFCYAALIDGFYLRQALGAQDPDAPDRAETEALAVAALAALLTAEGA
jgi:TetR/AcrR family transcriptional repressor of bet genes